MPLGQNGGLKTGTPLKNNGDIKESPFESLGLTVAEPTTPCHINQDGLSSSALDSLARWLQSQTFQNVLETPQESLTYAALNSSIQSGRPNAFSWVRPSLPQVCLFIGVQEWICSQKFYLLKKWAIFDGYINLPNISHREGSLKKKKN